MARTKVKPITLCEPHPKQLDVLRALEDSSVKTVIVIAGRQSGKTFLAKNQVIYWAINDPGCKILWVSPTDSQMRSVYREIMEVCWAANVLRAKNGKQATKGDTQLNFANGSQILFRCGGTADNLRGISAVNYTVLDEAAYLKRDLVENIVLPMMTTSFKKLYIISTPKGKNFIYDYYHKGLMDPSWRSFKYSSYESPYANIDAINAQKELLTEAFFRQEYLCDWIDKCGVFNNINDVLCLDRLKEPEAGDTYYAGIDIGLENDSSVMTVLNSEGNVVNVFRWTRTKSTQLINDIMKLQEKWKFKKILLENNNQGLVFYQIMKPKMYNLQDINTTLKNKNEAINDLIYLFNSKTIKICKDVTEMGYALKPTEQLKIELEAFLMTQEDNNKLKFSAGGGMTDDCVMSLAIARTCYNRFKSGGRFIGIHY